MTTITRLALQHRRIVALAWLLLTVAGVLTVSGTTSRLSHGFNTPGTTGYDANLHISKHLGIDGNEQPTIAVLKLPPGQTMRTAAGQAAAATTFAAANRAGHVAVADYANTHNPRLISRDGRTTWALIDMPNPDTGTGTGVLDRIAPALRAASPAGASVAVTGFEQIQSAGGGSGGGPSVLIETAIGAVGALAVLAFVFGSAIAIVPLAIKAVVVNLVSLGATFGFLVLFWQDGHGSSLIFGVPATGSIRNWIPIVTFAFLFGISMDYEVFILARMREEYDRTRSTHDAIVQALARTGRLVTCGALILAISFASLSTAPDIVVEMIATALAVGILIDALIVRTLLVPALVAIMGRWNWWMPDGFARLLRLPPAAAVRDPPHARAAT
jgi:RND superfamily putative drug exporter